LTQNALFPDAPEAWSTCRALEPVDSRRG